jgi:hypothetical protein
MSHRAPDTIADRSEVPVLRATQASAALVGLLWLALATPGGTAAQPPAGVDVRVSAEPQKATVGDLIRIDILVTAPKGFAVQVLDPGRRVAAFDVLEFFPVSAASSDKKGEPEPAAEGSESPRGSVFHRARIVVAIYKTGEFEFPPLSIILRDPNGKETTVASTPVKVQIQSVLAVGDEQLKDLRKQVDIPEDFRWRLWLGALAALLAILAAVYWLRRRSAAPAAPATGEPHAVDPLEAAEAELRELLGSRLLEKGFVKEFYVSLADVVKKMLEAGYGIQALEKTSAEILEELRQESSQHPRGRDLEEIAGLLTACDMVKFARYIPGEREHGASAESALKILEACRKMRSAPPAPLLATVPETS